MKKTFSIRLEESEFEKARKKFGSAIVYKCFNAVCRGLLLCPEKILFDLLSPYFDMEKYETIESEEKEL